MADNSAPGESKIAYHRRRAEDLKTLRSPWEHIWTELAKFIEPTRYKHDIKPEGWTSRRHIIDITATMSWRTLKSGMHSGITSPARPWFKWKSKDPDLNKWGPVKEWLQAAEDRARDICAGSNIYSAFHTGYGDMGQFGQSCGILMEDNRNVIRMLQLVHGQFWLARDENGRCNSLYRRFEWPVHRIVNRFGLKNLSRAVREAYDQSRYDAKFTIWHAIEPRYKRNTSSQRKQDKPFLSNYWEDGRDSSPDARPLLEESGFDTNPIIAPAWELSGDDTYSLSPGMVALGSIKMLMKEQSDKLDGIEKQVKPPMTGPTSMEGSPASLVPGSITYSDDPTGKGYRPAFEVNWNLANLIVDIKDVQNQCDRAFFADLFMMLANMEGVQPRNTLELSERKEEKLLQLGPVLENIYNDQLDPFTDRLWDIMQRRRLLPPPPQELQGQMLDVEYTSMLAQAMKAQRTGSIERMWAFVGTIAAAKPEVMDKLKGDETIDAYGDMVGYPADAIATEEEVQQIRAKRAQDMAMEKNIAAAPAMAQAAKGGADAAQVMSELNQSPQAGSLLQQLGIG